MYEVKRTSFTGKFFRRIFSGEKGYSVNLVMTDDITNIPEAIANERGRTMITVTGVDLPDLESVEIQFYGSWVNSKYGKQFSVDAYEYSTPNTKKGIISFLKSDIFPGVGKKLAERIVAKFGLNTFEVISKSPEQLLEVKGITPQKLGRIVSGYLSAKSYSELTMFLAEYGIGASTLVKINDTYGSNAIEIIKKDPYQIINIAGIGFKTCDKIARGLNVSLDSYTRVKCSITESIRTLCESTGNMNAEINEVYKRSMKLLNDGITPAPVDKAKFEEVFHKMQERKLIAVRYSKLVYLMEYDNAEREVALKLLGMLEKPVVQKNELEWSLKKYVDYMAYQNVRPSEKQQQAVINSLSNRVAIITGGPGTGKTTITKLAISVYKDVMREQVTCMAPTGKAARRMAEATGENATTIHSRLGIYDDSVSELHTIDSGLVVIDEVSMVDNLLMQKVMEAINLSKCHLLLIGDVNQLPSVGVGAVLNELINSGKIPTTMLTEIFRQKDGGLIVDNAIKINNGETDLEYGDDFQFIEVKNEDEAIEIISKIYPREKMKWGIDNVALLSPLRRSQNGRFKCVSDTLNPILQDIVNKQFPTSGMTECTVGDITFRLEDRVMQWKNTKHSSNGDIGVIQQIFEDEDEELTVRIMWDNGKEILAHKKDLESITLAYSMSVHKSQGSEYDCVIIPVLSCQSCQLFKRNLLYTGVTRAKKKVILVGDKKAIEKCIKQSDTNKRNTLLADRIVYNADKAYPTVK